MPTLHYIARVVLVGTGIGIIGIAIIVLATLGQLSTRSRRFIIQN